MLKVIVVDSSAEARNRLLDRLQQLLESNSTDLDILPRIDIKPLSRQELKFHEPPDICVIGAGILCSDLQDVGAIRRIYPESGLLASLSPETSSFSTLEQLARLGIDDTMLHDIAPGDFLRKIVLLSRRARTGAAGKLIVVDSGKGGLGVTSLAAAAADALVARGKKVTLLDFDFETQDLSRFLQARPFINENLQLLFDQQRPVTQEYVEQAMVRVWEHGKGVLTCVSPIEESEDLYSGAAHFSRTLISILEVLDSCADCVIADCGSARGSMLRTLYRVADKVLFVLSNDPATMYASTDRLAQLRGYISSDSEIVLALNSPSARGLPAPALVDEFGRTLGIRADSWCRTPIPHCPIGQRWPGSGGTLYTQAKRSVRRSIDEALDRLGFGTAPSRETVISPTFSSSLLRRMLVRLASFGPDVLRSRPNAIAAGGVDSRLALSAPLGLIGAPQAETPTKQVRAYDKIDLESLILPAVVS